MCPAWKRSMGRMRPDSGRSLLNMLAAAVLSDQLTWYQRAVPDAEQGALCVLVKTKEPQIDWRLAKRSEQLVEFLAKAEYVAGEIAAGRFYKRPGKRCSLCDYLPVCTGDAEKMRDVGSNQLSSFKPAIAWPEKR